MRFPIVTAALTLLAFLSPSAFAGTVSFVNGELVWQSTLCPVPAMPPSLAMAGSESRAEGLNAMIGQYNQYVQATQTYMNCVSSEVQHDGQTTNESIVRSGQAVIADMQRNVAVLGSALQAKP
jgi:hypothetical protein